VGQKFTLPRTDRVSYLEPRAGLEAGDELSVQTGGVEGQGQLLRDAVKLQLNLGTNFLATPMQQNTRNTETWKDECIDYQHGA